MTHIRSRLLLATAVASLAFTATLSAQPGAGAPRPRDGQGPAGAMERGGPAGGPMAGARERTARRGQRGNPAAMLLRLRNELQLTDDQVKRLEALQDAPGVRPNAAEMLRARADLLEATQGDANVAKARAALDRLSALRNEQVIAGLKQRQEVRAVLTTQQKARLDNMRNARRSGMGGAMRQGGAARGERGMVRGRRGGREVGPGAMGAPFRAPRGPNGPVPPAMGGGMGRRGEPVSPDGQPDR